MQKFDSSVHKYTVLNPPHGVAHKAQIPSVGWKMFQRTSESTSSIR